MRIGDKIKVLLDSRGMTQRELAKKIGITEVSMSRYANNSRVPKGPLVAAMAKALGVSADELLGLAEGPVISDDKPPSAQPETHEKRTEERAETHVCDLIDRQAAIDALADMHCKSDEDGYVWIIRSDAWARIDALPSVTPERKTGKWERAYLDHEAMGERPSILYCSVCNQCIAYPVNYCPNCGADMRGEQDG